MPDQLGVSPSARLNRVDESRVQVRFPDHQHVTLEYESDILIAVLSTTQANTRAEWIARIASLGLDTEAAGAMLDGLVSVGVIHPTRMQVNDVLDAILVREDNRTRAVKFGEIDDFAIQTVAIWGQGELAAIAARAARGVAGIEQIDNVADLVLVAHDTDGMPNLLAAWAAAPSGKFKTALWFDGGALRLGPGYITSETACLNCYAARTEAASQFIDEARRYRAEPALPVCTLPLGDTVAHLAAYIVSRTLRLARTGQFDVLQPGQIESWSTLSGRYSSASVVRNPFCPSCGRHDAPLRAIRDMT